METLKAGDKRLISYAVDLDTRITEAFGSKQAIVREIHANRGILTTKLAGEETRTYTIRNIDKKAKTLILEHPLRSGYTLLNQKATEKTPGAYRFEIALAPGAGQEFVVAEERVFDQSFGITNLTPDQILSYVRNRVLSDAGRRQLQDIAGKKSQIAENDRGLQETERQIRDLSADEERIRQNIGSLNKRQRPATAGAELCAAARRPRAAVSHAPGSAGRVAEKEVGATGRAGEVGGGPGVLAAHFAGAVAGAPFCFTKNTRNLAGLVSLAFLETV